jgi:large subunit ribosomal protein L16
MVLLFPLKTKFKKYHKRIKILKRKELNYNQPLFGFYGLKIKKPFRLTSVQIETLKKSISKILKKNAKSKIKSRLCIFPDISVTKKATGLRMGKGKGNVEFWCSLVKKGRIILELNKHNMPKSLAYKAFFLAGQKLPGFSIPIVF